MLKVKHFLDTVEPDDGYRIWVEPFRLTRDLVEMCQVSYCMTHIAPPMALWSWFEHHPDGYEYFREKYHMVLDHSAFSRGLHSLALAVASDESLTLLHQEDDPEHNSATALAEYLSELAAWRAQDL